MTFISAKKKEIEDSLWSVFTSFGFLEIEKSDDVDFADNSGKFCYCNKSESAVINAGKQTAKSKAETVAACIESVIVNGVDSFKIEVCDDKEVIELLYLFGFEKLAEVNKSIKNGFKAISGEIEFAKGSFNDSFSECIINMDSFMSVLYKSGIDMSGSDVQTSLMFAEKNAEGLAYDVAYSLRVNGCIVEYYNGSDSIEEACSYAEKRGILTVLRAYADGKLQIKDYGKGEIIETTVNEFLGYYEDDECGDDCDCGENHHDGCSCGGHHEHGDDCGCGENHEHHDDCGCGKH